MKFVLINNAPDGRHVRVFKTMANARKALGRFLGRDEKFDLHRPYFSDYGNRLVIEERADDWNASLERRIANAFDARECGTATKAQLALLEKGGF